MKKDQRINIVTDETTKWLLEQRAEMKKMSLSELLIEGGLLYGSLDQGFIEELDKRAAEIGMKLSLLLQNLVINQIAVSGAFQKVFGRPSNMVKNALQFKDGRIATGDDLLEILNDHYERLFARWHDKLELASKTGKPFEVSAEDIELLGTGI